jgi:hypothetical protein
VSAVPRFDPTLAGAPASAAEDAAQEAPQRFEDILPLGHRPGEAALEPPRCLGELVEDAVLLLGHPDVVPARGKLAHWTGQAGDIGTRLLGSENAEYRDRCPRPWLLERIQ